MKLFKKILSLFLTATIILSITPLQALASGNTTAYQSGDLYYEIKLDHIEIVGCAESATEVIVPATIEELPVTVIAQSAFNGHTNLTSFTAPSTLIHISKWAFRNCSQLQTVDLSGSAVTTIDAEAFQNCSKLTTVNMPSVLETIGEGAFQTCTSLTSIDLSGSVLTTIGNNAFNGCSSLTSVAFPSTLTSWGMGAFSGCALSSVDLSSTNVTEITSGFGTSLSSISLPDGLATIGESVFARTALTEIVFPDSLTFIGKDAFAYCTSLASVTWPENDDFTTVNGFKGCTSLTDSDFLQIPSSVTAIGEEAFAECAFTTITIPSNITTIGVSAFSTCESMTSLTIESGLQTIGSEAFIGCNGLTGKTIDIPATVNSIEWGAFSVIGENEETGLYDKPFTLIIRNRDISLVPEDSSSGIFLYDENGENPLHDILDYSCGAQLYGYSTNSSGQPSDLYTMFERKVVAGDFYGTFTKLESEELTDTYTVSGVIPEGASVKVYRGNEEVTTEIGDTANSFTASVEAGADILVKISLTGYNDLYLGRSISEFTADWDIGTITTADMTPAPLNHKLYVSITRNDVPYRSFNKLTFTVKNGDTVLTEGTDYTVDYPYIILDESIEQDALITLTVSPSAELMLAGGTATGTKETGAFSEIELLSWGYGLITLVGSSADAYNVLIFDSEGALVDSSLAADGYQTAQLPSDTYSVVAFEKNELFSSVASISQLNAMGLTAGEDYAYETMTITDGTETELTLNVPELDIASLSSILNTDGTAVLVDVQDVAAGETVCAHIQYSLKNAPSASATVSVVLPESADFLGAYDDTEKQNISSVNNTLSLATQSQSGTFYIFFSVDEAGEHSISASISVSGVTAPIGSAVFTVEKLRVDAGGRWLTSKGGNAVIYAKPGTSVTVTLPDGSNKTAYANQVGRASVPYNLPESVVSGDRFAVTAEQDGVTASDEVVYMPSGTQTKDLYFVYGGKKTELIRDGLKVVPEPHYVYEPSDLEAYRYWTFGATLTSNTAFSEDEPVRIVVTMMDGSMRTADMTRISQVAAANGWEYTYAGEMYIESAGEHVFRASLIPRSFELVYNANLEEIDTDAVFDRAWEEAMERYDLIYSNDEIIENAFDEESLGALLSGAYKVSDEEWFDELPQDVQNDVLAAETALEDAAEVYCSILGIDYEDVDEYLIPSADPDSPPTLDVEKVLAENGVTISEHSEFDADALAADGYTIYQPAAATYRSSGNRIAVKNDENTMNIVSEADGSYLQVNYSDHASSNAATAIKLQVIDKSATLIEVAVDKLENNPKVAGSKGFMSMKVCGWGLSAAGTILGGVDAWNNVTDLGKMWSDIESLRGYHKNLQMWLARYQTLGYGEECLSALRNEIIAVGDLIFFLQQYAQKSDQNISLGLLISGLDAVTAGLSSVLFDYVSNGTAAYMATEVETYIVAWDLARMRTARDCEGGEEIAKKYWQSNTVHTNPIMDPSGIVYEALESNPLDGVTATIWYDADADHTSGVTQWDASAYDQVNPQTTGTDGAYAWDVPQGYWQVRFTKNGYHDAATDWMEVPPPRMNLTTPMISTEAPEVTSANAYPDYIEVIFSQYMDKTAQLTLPDGMTGTWQGNDSYSKVLRITKPGEFTIGDIVILTISGAKNYAGTALADYSDSLIVGAHPAEILLNYESVVTMKAGEAPNVTVRVKDSEGNYMSGVTVEAEVANTLLATIDASAVTDADGKAVFAASALLPGLTEITFTVNGTTLTKTMDLRITVDDNRPARPTASVGTTEYTAASPKENSITVESGTVLTIRAEAGTTIYYTIDDTCPCQNSASRKVYTGPITITQNTRFRITAYKDGMEYSDRLNITVTVSTPSAPTYTVSFDANGGTGTMADVTGISGEYTLPACTFGAPSGQQFKAWKVGGIEKAVGDKITVTANTTVTAVWENIPTPTYTVSFDANGGTGTMADVTGISGEYTLPACTFGAPSGQQFKAWKVGGVEKAVGDKINVAADTTVTAVWEDVPAGHIHNLKPVAKVEPSCTESGKNAYYKCDGCGKFFEDDLGAKEITNLANWGNIDKLGHTPSDWKSDKDNHWKECNRTDCGAIIENSKAAHIDENKDGKCDVCVYEVDVPTDPDDNKPSDNPETGDNGNLGLWMILSVLSCCLIIALIVIDKKRKIAK